MTKEEAEVTLLVAKKAFEAVRAQIEPFLARELRYQWASSRRWGGDGTVELEVSAFVKDKRLPDMDEVARIVNRAMDSLGQELELAGERRRYAELTPGWIKDINDIFCRVGLPPACMEKSDNPYRANGTGLPKLRVYTGAGIFSVHWRRRVIALDWSRTCIEASAETLFPGEDVTKEERSIHVWSYEKLEAYLKVIAGAQPLVSAGSGPFVLEASK